MPRKNIVFNKEELEQRKKDGKIAFTKRKKELYEKFSKTFSYIILSGGRPLSTTIKLEISKNIRYKALNPEKNSVGGYWLIKKKDFEKAEAYAKKYKLKMKDITHILDL